MSAQESFYVYIRVVQIIIYTAAWSENIQLAEIKSASLLYSVLQFMIV